MKPLSSLKRLSLPMLAAFLPLVVCAQQREDAAKFQFETYTTTVRYTGPVATVDFARVPQLDQEVRGQSPRALVEEALKHGPNFAGDRILVHWYDGPGSVVVAIIDARTGQVQLSGGAAQYGLEFRLDSNLLVFNPPRTVLQDCQEGHRPAFSTESSYSQWNGTRLVSVGSFDLCSIPQAAPVSAPTPGITSAYTETYPQQGCRFPSDPLASPDQDQPEVCPGFTGILVIHEPAGAYRQGLSIQDTDGGQLSVTAVQDPTAVSLEADHLKQFGKKIEWRLADGKPFAFIVRVTYFKDPGQGTGLFQPQDKVAEFLFVRGLSPHSTLQSEINVRTASPNANEAARQQADAFLLAAP